MDRILTGKELAHALKRSEGLKTFVYSCRDRKYTSHTDLQWERDTEKFYERKMQRPLDLRCPKTFTEKIQWLKLYDCTEIKTTLADKFLVRDWVGQTIGQDHLVPLLGVWDHFDEIDWAKLPDQFCLKMNHGSAMNYVVEDKEKTDRRKLKKLFACWEKRPYYAGSLELQYYHIPRKVLAEKYIREFGGGLYDYKIHCFNGRPAFIQCIGDRDLKNHAAYQRNFDLEWKPLDWTLENFPRFPHEVPRPERLEELVACAARLAKGFAYVRVDLYDLDGRVCFGEMTFTPASGVYPYKGSWTQAMDQKLGDLLELPKEKHPFVF